MASIIMTAYKRAPQLRRTLESIRAQGFAGEVIVAEDGDDGETRGVSAEYGAIYINRVRGDELFRAPCELQNRALFMATGNVAIIQNAECEHSPGLIDALTAPHEHADNLAVFARIRALNAMGGDHAIYCGPEYPRPFFFCGSIRMANVRALNGFDEDYVDYGFEDNDFADRMTAHGMEYRFLTDTATHQWHGYDGDVYAKNNGALYREKMAAMNAGLIGVRRNAGKYWDA